MASDINTSYAVLALYRTKKRGSYQYEWKEIRTFGSKKEASDYAKRESNITYRGRTGRYLVEKRVLECMYEDGKIAH